MIEHDALIKSIEIDHDASEKSLTALEAETALAAVNIEAITQAVDADLALMEIREIHDDDLFNGLSLEQAKVRWREVGFWDGISPITGWFDVDGRCCRLLGGSGETVEAEIGRIRKSKILLLVTDAARVAAGK